jgi:hypothetical protein
MQSQNEVSFNAYMPGTLERLWALTICFTQFMKNVSSFFISGLFNDAFSSSDYIASNDGMINE